MDTIKFEILKILRENAPKNVSGEELSKRLGVTRTAVWKNIKKLVSEGYKINASTKNGYGFVSAPDVINEFEIENNLDVKVVGSKVHFIKSIDSTNNYARKIAAQGAENGTAVVSLCQTAGRGRLGRTWFSAADTGIYISVILKPDLPLGEMQILTIAAAAAAVRAIKGCTGLDAAIKWPNDIILDGRKICGILTEASLELDRINYIVIGTGINYSQKAEDFPEEIRDKAVSLLEAAGKKGIPVSCGRLEIIRSYLKELDFFYEEVISGRTREILEFCKNNSATLGREVMLVERNETLQGKAVDINERGWLIVRLNDGTLKEVSSGEVSVRGLLGYSS